jgi:thiamine transport system permease protein
MTGLMQLQNSYKFNLLFIPGVLILILLFYLPLSLVLKSAFLSSTGNFTLNNIIDVLISDYNRRIIGFTLFQAFLSTIFTLVLGLPGAWLLAKKQFPGKRILKAVSAVPFVLPSILVVLGFVIFFGNNGFLNKLIMSITDTTEPPLRILYSMTAIILAHGFYNFPIVLRLVSTLWEKLDKCQANAAMSLGAGRFRLFFTVTLPQLLPVILASSALVFVFCFTSFAVILVLGGGPAFTTIEVEIYRQARISLNLNAAAALSIVGILITLIFVYINVHFQSSLNYHEHIKNPDIYTKTKETRFKTINPGIFIYVLIIVLLVAAPVISIIIKSFLQPAVINNTGVFSSSAYRDILNPSPGNYGITLISAIANSISYAGYTVILSIIIGTLVSFILRGKKKSAKFLDTLFMLPISVSSVILGLGYLRLMNLIRGPLKHSSILIILAHTIIAYPFVTRAVKPVLDKIKPEIIYAGLSLGERPFRVFLTIEFPLIKSAIFSGAAFAFAISIGEMNATILLSSENTLTIPIMMYRLIGSYNFTAACALGTILIIFTTFSFILMDYFGSESKTGGMIKK